MIEIYYTQEDGSVISEISSGLSAVRQTDIFIFGTEEEFFNRQLVADLPPDMRLQPPKSTFSVLDALKTIPRLRPYIQDRKLGFYIKPTAH